MRLGLYVFVLASISVCFLAEHSQAQTVAVQEHPVLRESTETDDRVGVAVLAARVDLLAQQLERSEELHQKAEDKATQHLIWVSGLLATLFTVLTTLMGLFINSRIKEPEDFRENLRAQMLQDLDAARNLTVRQTDAAIEQMSNELKAAQREHAAVLEEMFTAARIDAEKFRDENSDLLRGLENLASLGQPSPTEHPEAETLYYLATQARAEEGAEGRAKGLRYLRRLAMDDIPAIPPVLHNAAILAKEYHSQELAIDLLRRAFELSGSTRYGASLAHELALSHSQDESLAIFEDLLRCDPDNAHTFHFYVDSLRALGLFERAQAALQENEERFSGSAKVQREWADLLRDMGQYEAALERAKRASDLDPGDEIAWWYQGNIARIMGDLDTAKDALLQAVQLADESSPRLGDHLRGLADIYRMQGAIDDAQRHYEAALIADRSPSRSVRWLNIIANGLLKDPGGGSGPPDGTRPSSGVPHVVEMATTDLSDFANQVDSSPDEQP